MGTPWDARTYDKTSAPQQSWAEDVLNRLPALPPDGALLDVGCGTGIVTEQLMALVPEGRVYAIDASQAMVELARRRLGSRATVLCQDALELDVGEPLDGIVSTAALHWVRDHERLWPRLAGALRPAGVLEAQCGGAGNIEQVRIAIEAAAEECAPELVGWSPWTFADPEQTERRLRDAGFEQVRCWLEERPTVPEDLDAFVRTSILAAHFERLAPERREPFATAVLARIDPPLGYVRLNISARRAG